MLDEVKESDEIEESDAVKEFLEARKELDDIESKIADCIKRDKTNWVEMYQLLAKVKEEKLYDRAQCNSFSSWMNMLAFKMHVHVSVLWARLKAGKNYQEYEERAKKTGRVVKPLEEINVSPDSINLAARVAGRDANEMDNLIDKVVDGTLKRADLRDAVGAKRASGTLYTAFSRYDALKPEDKVSEADHVTASDIVFALKNDYGWLPVARSDKHFDHRYHVYTEFRCDTGTAKHARLMDALVCETITCEEKDSVNLRGIEIKISKSDLLKDEKMQEYTAFCDFFYLALPMNDPELLQAAYDVKLPEWGILLINKEGNVVVEMDAQRLEGIFRDKTLSNCVLKLISTVKV